MRETERKRQRKRQTNAEIRFTTKSRSVIVRQTQINRQTDRQTDKLQ